MFRNYFKVAIRNLVRNKLYSIVNIAGLSIGIACCILIGLYIFNELSYDRFNKNADRIVRVNTEYSVDRTIVKTSGSPTRPGPLFARTFPQVESFVRLVSYPRIVRYADKIFDERVFTYA